MHSRFLGQRKCCGWKVHTDTDTDADKPTKHTQTTRHNRQTGRQAGRQTDRQTDRQTARQTDRQTHLDEVLAAHEVKSGVFGLFWVSESAELKHAKGTNL